MTQDHLHHWRQIIKGLAKRDARFVAIRKGEKLPTSKGWNKTENTLSAADAIAHLATGGNVGHAAGTGNVYEWDFDFDAERGYECPYFDGALHVARANAPHKAKFFFTCDEVVPSRPRSKKHGFDLLGVNNNGTHAQGVIAGMHPSGDAYRWGGHHIPHLHIDQVVELFADWADGEELFPPVRESTGSDATYADADISRVADALKYVDPNDMGYNTWIGIIAALHDTFGDDALPLVIDWADGKRGEVEDKWGTFDREYTGKAATLNGLFYRARIGGWPDNWLQDRLRQYRQWIASPEAIEELKATGFKNPERARKLLDTILQKCEEKKSLRIAPGYAYLSKNSTVGLGRMSDYLGKLFAGGFINLRLGEKAGDATTIELVFHNVNTFTPDGETIHVAKNWNIYREQRDSEAFINNHHAYSSTRTQATLKPLGDNGLGALLALLDGPVTTREAADLIGYSYGSMALALRRYAAHGMVDIEVGERNRKTYTLKEEWSDILKANLPRMTTYAVPLVRHVDALRSRAKMLAHKGEDEKAAKVDAEHKRMAALLVKVKETAGIIPFVHTGRKDVVGERLDRLRQAQRIGDRAHYRPKHRTLTEADQWRRKEYAKDITAAGYNWGEFHAWASMTQGPSWWMHLDITEILGKYRVFELMSDNVPTIHWDGDPAPSVVFEFYSGGEVAA